MDDVTGVILAGGESRRFGGEDKALFLVDGRPMIERVYQTVRAVTQRILLSVRDSSAHPPLPVPVVTDRYQRAGPLAGLHAGLTETKTPWILLVACDLPRLTPAVLEALLAARDKNVEVVAARTPDARVQPLCACYHADLLPLVESQLASGCRSLRELLAHVHGLRYVEAPGRTLSNVNTLSDLDG